MIILIPIGGIGKRFKDKGFDKPKSLINVCNKPILYYLLDNLNLENIDFVYIPYNKEYLNYDFENKLKNHYPEIKFKFLILEKNTRGAAETISIALNKLISDKIRYPINFNEMKKNFDKPILCLDSDNFYLNNIIKLWNGQNCLFTINDKGKNPIFSYVKTNSKNIITEIEEKNKISDSACTGAYGFESYYELKNFIDKIIMENKMQKGEFYTSCVVKEMIENKYKFKNIDIKNKNYFSLGTPEQVKLFENPFIFDLDGTLINTDFIYINVWKKILKKYNLSIDDNFFNFFIRGKNDILFLKSIFSEITNEKINEISIMKDNLFIEMYKKQNKDIMIDGALKFIESNKNRRMGIVTSCNKKSAEFIIKKTGLENYMQFLIASEDCRKHKPNKEPYQKAINILNCDKKNCVIFEDSNSGYKSAKSLGGKICLILNDNSSNDIINSNEYKIRSYYDFDLKKINKNNENKIEENIKLKLKNLLISKVLLNNIDLKTGYICDIKSLKLILNDRIENVIYKVENIDNELSDVARKINLYENEVYFYEKLAKLVNVETPKFYCSLNINNKKSIILEDLNFCEGIFNIDLDKNIDLILNIVKSISKMHNSFYFKKKEDIIESMKNILKINEIKYYEELINNRFKKFLDLNNILLSVNDKKILNNIFKNYKTILENAGKFPLNFCHGDLKSPNIFYKKVSNKNIIPVFLDWQYIHLNKGISDITFLLIESTKFNEITCDIILKYYFKKSIMYDNLNDLLFDFKIALCLFPFFVMVWFNSENRDNLLDKIFPINFMKNTLKFYNKYLDDSFFNNLK